MTRVLEVEEQCDETGHYKGLAGIYAGVIASMEPGKIYRVTCKILFESEDLGCATARLSLASIYPNEVVMILTRKIYPDSLRFGILYNEKIGVIWCPIMKLEDVLKEVLEDG